MTAFDFSIIFVGIIGTAYFLILESTNTLSSIIAAYLFLFSPIHIFYFSSIVRMSKFFVWVWSTCLLSLQLSGVYYGVTTLLEAGIMTLIIVALLTALEMRKPSYHGIFWSKINPNLHLRCEKKNADS